MNHLVSLKEWDGNLIESVVDKGIEVKNNPEKYYNSLSYKSLALIFQKTSTRTRVAFEVGMTQLGGHALYIDWKTTNFVLSDIRDEVKFLSTNVDLIMARLVKNSDIMLMAEAASIPVINGCCEKYHPCQILSDYMTIKEKAGRLKDVNLVFVGIHNNVCNSHILGAAKVGVNLTLVTPEIHDRCVDDEVMSLIDSSPNITKTNNIKEAVQSADFVYTDSWVDMELFLDPSFEKEKKERIDKMMPFQLNKENLSGTKAYIMHDMPIHEGYEITREMIEDERSVIFQQSENRLHMHKSIMLKLLNQF